MRVPNDNIGTRSLSFCKFNIGIECAESGRTCDKCGWNPEVAERRKRFNRRRRGEDI